MCTRYGKVHKNKIKLTRRVSLNKISKVRKISISEEENTWEI